MSTHIETIHNWGPTTLWLLTLAYAAYKDGAFPFIVIPGQLQKTKRWHLYTLASELKRAHIRTLNENTIGYGCEFRNRTLVADR